MSLSKTSPFLLTTIAELRSWRQERQAKGESVGLVPTMGALHEGHLSLMKAAKEKCDCSLATIFVNPTQFGPQEDLEKYPRRLQADCEMLRQVGASALFVPTKEMMYPSGFSSSVNPPEVAKPWEGAHRPDHFCGVVTVVLKLFNLAQAEVAFFGQKDFQQARVIEQMATDLNVPTEIVVCPTVREEDGLAMSSRNAYLSAAERQRALSLWRALTAAEELVQQGEQSGLAISRQMQSLLEQEVDKLDYAVLADRETLAEAETVDRPLVALIAAYVQFHPID